MNQKPYYLGLDMGTTSVGWAVTDKEYHLLRKKGKDLWGVRLFEEAKTSVDRRTNRVSRRRRQREQARIGYLKLVFEEEIQKVDPLFYQRLDNSRFYPEDKDEALPDSNGIFADKDYTDRDYYAQFPTIFHLRKELIENSQASYDVRFVFLALLNMFKHRGHFLNTSLSSEGSGSLEETLQSFRVLADEEFDIVFSEEELRIIQPVLTEANISRTKKADTILEKLGESGVKVDKKEPKYYVIRCLCGLKVDLCKIIKLDTEEKVEVCFSDFGYEEKIPTLEMTLGEDYYSLIESMKAVYDAAQLARILGEEKYLSFSRVRDYEQHREDLKLLKSVYKALGAELYRKMFRSEEPGSYSAYIGSVNSDDFAKDFQGKKIHKLRRSVKERGREALYARIKKDLAKSELPEANKIMEAIEKEQFLPKQLTAANGVIPNQVHAIEMKAILDNAEKYLPFLSRKNEYGLTVSQQILQLFSWQIPYYIGPVSSDSAKMGGNGWVVRKKEGPVYPWTFDEMIDEGATREGFMVRLVKECTYLSGEKVLPKQSLLYQRYCVLNEINNIRIRGERISVELKQEIYHTLFEKGKRVTRKQLESFLSGKGLFDESADLSGIDQNINNALTSYGRLLPIFGNELRTDSGKRMAEDIIKLCTVYGDAKKKLEEQIVGKYGDRLSIESIKRLLGNKFKDWGNLSRELLEMQGCCLETGETMSLIQAMWETQYNFMELINSSAFTFKEEIEKRHQALNRTLREFTFEDLEDYYFSAPVKRMVWQTLQIIREIEKVMGYAPERVFIEVTRRDEEKGDKGRKASRANSLRDLYKHIKKEVHNEWQIEDWSERIGEQEKTGDLRSKKLFLYYMQWGRCLYTGKRIELNDLMDNNLYDIDHIYPRHYIKDDNISNNLVLVSKQSNAYKSDDYPIPSVPSEARKLWKALHDSGFINDEKYRRLTSRNPLTDEQKAGFIARQLVETSQGIKGVADLLKQLLQDSEVVYSKASNVSDFRNEFSFYKARSLNDIHHAQDAYLNIVVGNVYHVKFGRDPRLFIKKDLHSDPENNHYNLGKMFSWNVVRGSEIAWIAPKKDAGPGTLGTVQAVMRRGTQLITRMSFERRGAISKEQPVSKYEAKEEGYLSLKGSSSKLQDVQRYGGFQKISIAYFFLVEHEQKGKRIRTIEALPIVEACKAERDSEFLNQYCIQKLGLINPDIRLRKIRIQSTLLINGFSYSLQGKTGNSLSIGNNANLLLPEEFVFYVKQLEKLNEGSILGQSISKEKNEELYSILREKYGSTFFSKRINSISDVLTAGQEFFLQLSEQEQCYVLNNILKLSSAGANTADLVMIGGSSQSGKMAQNKKISGLKSCYLAQLSVTGLYEERIDLLTV